MLKKVRGGVLWGAYKITVIIQHSNSQIYTQLAVVFGISSSWQAAWFDSRHPSCKKWFLWYDQINQSIGIPEVY